MPVQPQALLAAIEGWSPQLTWFCIGFGSCLLLILLTAILRYRRRPYTLIREEHGDVRLSPSGIQQLVERLCEKEGLSSRSRARGRVCKGRLYLHIELQVEQLEGLIDASERLRLVLTDGLNRCLGEPHVGQVDVTVTGLRLGEDKQKEEKKEKEPRTEDKAPEPFVIGAGDIKANVDTPSLPEKKADKPSKDA